MPHITIDNLRVEAKEGKTVIETAYENGIDIPHFCWHPELSISGNCRMCLVEVGLPKRLPDGGFEKDEDGKPIINYFPKLQIACATRVADGMHVRTRTEKVTHAHEAVMEFFLINHPLDCPICDEAGECKLQEYAFRHSRGESRFDEMKNRFEKRVQWGPNVVFDSERCIRCSRCIRFAQEIADQDVLTFTQRGDHVNIQLAEGTQLDNPYSMNVIDICPVGALTSDDFRFRARVWDMSFNDSICPGCARGCNIKVGVRNNEILRLQPRVNMYVNKYWMCDPGRLGEYKFVNENRVTDPLTGRGAEKQVVHWDAAFQQVAENLKKFKPEEMMFLVSGDSTCEDAFLAQRLAKQVMKTNNIDTAPNMDKSFSDNLLRCAGRNANLAGVREVGVEPAGGNITWKDFADKLTKGRIKALYIMDEHFRYYPEILDHIGKVDYLVVHAHNHSKLTEAADVVLPSSTYAETEGTWVNINQRVQHFEPAVVTTENRGVMGMKMSRLDRFGAHNDRWTHHETRNCRPGWKIVQGVANQLGANWKFKNAEEVFNEIARKVKTFSGMDYELLDEYQGVPLGKADKPDPKVTNYTSHYMKPHWNKYK
ncbi:MAG: molybdopterin-dependent oxidoreductase [Candidatus Kapaibacterium sp.]